MRNMTVSTAAARPAPSRNEAAHQYFEHSRAPRVNTDAVVVEALRIEYPELHLSVIPREQCNLFAYCAAGHASMAPIDQEKDRLSWRLFLPPANRLSGQRGALADSIKFGKYLLDWQGKEYVMYFADGRDGGEAYPHVSNQYILSASVDATNKLIFEAGVWTNELHEEIWVYDGGMWNKDAELFASVQKSHWEDVILDETMKKALITDAETFFDSRDTYERLRVPWKRGQVTRCDCFENPSGLFANRLARIIYYGPPGNGKTISIKAMMNMLYKRSNPQVPTLYVCWLSSNNCEDMSV